MAIKNRQVLHKKILIVDSSLIVRKMIGFALQGSDYEIIEAADGVDAVRIIYSQPIDLLVTAMNMANINGLELSRIVRETSGLEDLPIIMLTQDENPVQQNEARGGGISLLISKPFSHAQIFSLIKEVLG
jgi:CheY-like chemotaxis protein